jgi:hypothetical protein
MNFYKISFNPEVNQTFRAFQTNFGFQYQKNTWSSDTHPFYLLATTETLETVRQRIDLSLGDPENQWPDFADMGLQIHQLGKGDYNLPAEAQAWLHSRQQAVQLLADFVAKH